MNNDQYLALAKRELDGVLELIRKKNSDYSGGSSDALANFRLCEDVGLAQAETGVLIRMMDKVQRIKSFIAKGELQVNESAEDAVRDIIGYSLALLGMINDRKKEQVTLELERDLSALTVIEPFLTVDISNINTHIKQTYNPSGAV